MFTKIREALHHLFNPHCKNCELREEESRRCKNCETYREMLDLANREKFKLMELLIDKVNPKPVEELPAPDFKPITSSYVPWASKRRELEAAERFRADEIRKKAAQPDSDVESLEELVLGGEKI